MALDTNDSGKISSDMPCAACTFPATRPSQTKTHMKAKPNTRVRPKAASASITVPLGPEADGEPDRRGGGQAQRQQGGLGDDPAREDGGAGHRQRAAAGR